LDLKTCACQAVLLNTIVRTEAERPEQHGRKDQCPPTTPCHQISDNGRTIFVPVNLLYPIMSLPSIRMTATAPKKTVPENRARTRRRISRSLGSQPLHRISVARVSSPTSTFASVLDAVSSSEIADYAVPRPATPPPTHYQSWTA